MTVTNAATDENANTAAAPLDGGAERPSPPTKHPATDADRLAAALACTAAARIGVEQETSRVTLANTMRKVAVAAVPEAIPASLAPIANAAHKAVSKARPDATADEMADAVLRACHGAETWTPPPETLASPAPAAA